MFQAMYEVTVEHPAVQAERFTCKGTPELFTTTYRVAGAQGQQGKDDVELGSAISSALWQADLTGTATLVVHAVTLTIEQADPSAYECEGHEDPAGPLGESVMCDGTCTRRPFTVKAALGLMIAIDGAELDAEGGCGVCDVEAGQMCAGCGGCNCEEHGSCERPVEAAG
ncbi:hypothetical protein [Embleya sp. AB8]|uniref:hypothetical protein n=1 Tax=Embleya sp. AB8 TaxID=3156304 RepID=UPI003C7816D8